MESINPDNNNQYEGELEKTDPNHPQPCIQNNKALNSEEKLENSKSESNSEEVSHSPINEEDKSSNLSVKTLSLQNPPNNSFQKISSLIQFFFIGIFLLSLIGHWETKKLESVKWARGKIIWNEGLIKAINEQELKKTDHRVVKVIPSVDIPSQETKNKILTLIEKIELTDTQTLPKITFPAIIWLNNIEEFQPILESGRLPKPGNREALSGDLTPSSKFFIKGTEYTVVGKIKKECAPFVGCFVIPIECIEKIPENVVQGIAILSLKTSPAHVEEITKLLSKDKIDSSAIYEISGLQSRTSPLFAYGTTIGLIIVCFSIRGLLRLYYYRLANPPTKLLGQLFSDIYNHKLIFGIINTFMYLVFFTFLFFGLNDPENHRIIIYYINHTFSEGELSYIGEAYAKGNILQAAITTFHNNFWVQTFLLTILISIPPILLGVFKTFISFAFAGFAMAPIWNDTASKLFFHSLTIGLELEAYILAVFGVIMWTYYFWNGIITRKNILEKIKKGFRIIVGASIVSGSLLAVAAIYEAITLIIFLI
ncbi:MAG: hypothetical protein N3G21_01220 [Candidatus Hydrogenedentes bacterium]|nr:hypothetical protein [Candidatus Hydrogenedentota bacterium]